jgi:hypothetical protein
MVRGLGLFKKHFTDFQEKYVLIGGTACTLAMEQAGIAFRATKDLDIVLCVETINKDFFLHLRNLSIRAVIKIVSRAREKISFTASLFLKIKTFLLC